MQNHCATMTSLFYYLHWSIFLYIIAFISYDFYYYDYYWAIFARIKRWSRTLVVVCALWINTYSKKKKKTEEGERVELTLSCSVKLLTECVGDIVPECVENIRLTILWWRVKWNSLITRHQCRPFKMKMNKKCLNCTKIKRKLFFLLLNN